MYRIREEGKQKRKKDPTICGGTTRTQPSNQNGPSSIDGDGNRRGRGRRFSVSPVGGVNISQENAEAHMRRRRFFEEAACRALSYHPIREVKLPSMHNSPAYLYTPTHWFDVCRSPL